jgi:hypothetical protein
VLVRALLLVLVLVLPASAQMGQPQRTPLPPSPPPRPPGPIIPGGVPDFLPPAQGCQTQWGLCPLACCVAPGTPCYCVTPSSAQIPGYAVQYYRP